MPEKTPFRKSIENLERELEKSQVPPWVALRLRGTLAAYPPIFVLTPEETKAAIRAAVPADMLGLEKDSNRATVASSDRVFRQVMENETKLLKGGGK